MQVLLWMGGDHEQIFLVYGPSGALCTLTLLCGAKIVYFAILTSFPRLPPDSFLFVKMVSLYVGNYAQEFKGYHESVEGNSLPCTTWILERELS